MNNYILSAEALRDLDEIYDYLANRSIAAANRFWDAVQQKCQLVANFPNMGKSYEYLAPSLRGFVVDDYLIFYYSREDGIDVTRLVSGLRDIESIFSEDDE